VRLSLKRPIFDKYKSYMYIRVPTVGRPVSAVLQILAALKIRHRSTASRESTPLLCSRWEEPAATEQMSSLIWTLALLLALPRSDTSKVKQVYTIFLLRR
jgi:hypothetical protein